MYSFSERKFKKRKMNTKKIRQIHSRRLLFVFLFLFISVGVVSLMPDNAYAAYKGTYSGTTKAVKYCKDKRKFVDNKNALKASACMYGFDRGYQKKSDNCNSAYRKEFTGRYAAEVSVCSQGYTEGKSVKAKETSSKSDDNASSGGSGSGDATNADSSPGAGNNATPEEETSEDGIPDNLGADIVAGQVKLTGSDATNAGIDNREPKDIIAGILNIVYSVSAVIAVIVIVVAGIMYITSDGDAARVGKAKSAIIYSAVGLVIIGSAFIITGIVQNIGT